MYPHSFVVSGTYCLSMEGFLQSLKTVHISDQRMLCSLAGMEAHRRGMRNDWRMSQTLYWQTTPIDRHSPDYQDFLNVIYRKMYAANPELQKLLISTGTEKLTHNVGRTNPHETVLTKQEFLGIINDIRKELILKQYAE
jgi:predicted NAD-dependent protein-ADP-ribosyltransferase YbiA (DUF1768 family)